ncbi:tripartite tricarboxylate transporter TctB family protein [Marinomonas gallaica]|uniref:tripartite tricarboxylate transporter TctB family protein n=1 Tax=Marinomonas gallaica TaxID=1806667 RepID=UPI003A8EF2C0
MQIDKTIFGGVMFSLAVAYGWGAMHIPEPYGGSESIGPATFPYILAVILGICSLFYMIKPSVETKWPTERSFIEICGVIATLFLYTILIEPAGFILATIICVTFMSWRLGAPVKTAAMVASIGSIVIFSLFNFGLDLPLPIGFGV